MRKFAFKNPFTSGTIAFLLVLSGGTLAGIILGLLIMASQHCEPTGQYDPCDGGAMAAGMIWSLSFSASLILGIVIGTSTYIGLTILRKRNRNCLRQF